MTKKKNGKVRILIGILVLALIVPLAAVPNRVEAASKKAKWKYSVKVNNLNSNLVLVKGSKYKISAKGQRKKGKKTQKATLKFYSSNKNVATVTSKGVIKTKKNGTTKITVYCKDKKSVKKVYTVRVGKRVSKIKLSGYQYLRPGDRTALNLQISPAGAKNKTIKWSSSNTSVAKVNSSGVVTANRVGTVTISAKAVDGSGVVGKFQIVVYQLADKEIKWIAHRGVNTEATENTKEAFELAGINNFWGTECDIWETKRPELDIEELPDEQGEQDEKDEKDEKDAQDEIELTDEEKEDVANLEATIEKLLPEEYLNDPEVLKGLRDSMELVKLLDASAAIVTAKEQYDEMSNEQKLSMEQNKRLALLLADALIKQNDEYDLAINHDTTYGRVFGDDRYVWDVPMGDVDPNVCFLGEFLTVCETYQMVPVIEIKGNGKHEITYEGIRKVINQIVDTGGYDMLKEFRFISFRKAALDKFLEYIEYYKTIHPDLAEYEPYTSLLIKENPADEVNYAVQKGFSSIGIEKSLLNDTIYNTCVENGLQVNTWTYNNKLDDTDLLYKHFLTGKYQIDTATANGLFFKELTF